MPMWLFYLQLNCHAHCKSTPLYYLYVSMAMKWDNLNTGYTHAFARASVIIVIDINIKSATPFWVATGYVRAWRKARGITSQHVHWLVFTCVGMIEHSFTVNLVIRAYHIYNDGWDAPISKVFYREWEIGNHSDPCVVAVKRATLGDASLI